VEQTDISDRIKEEDRAWEAIEAELWNDKIHEEKERINEVMEKQLYEEWYQDNFVLNESDMA